MRDAGSFWARRRAAVEAEEMAAAEAARRAEEEQQAGALDALDEAAALDELGLPDPETLGPGDDFAAFMRAGVPEKFRKVALRRLWRSNPVLACVDGLNDYDEDFRTQAAGQVVKTAYRVGEGMLAHLQHGARALAKVEDETAAAAETPDKDNGAALAAPGDADVDGVDAPRKTEAPQTHAWAEDAEPEAPAPRRMRFHFREATA